MLTDKELNSISVEYGLRFEAINVEYLEIMGKHLKEIGRLTPTDIHRLKQMLKMGANVKKINKKLMQVADLTVKDLNKLYDTLVENAYKDVAEFYIAKKGIQIPLKLNTELQTFLDSMKKLTYNTFKNMANTTVVSKKYKDAIDIAIQAVASGTTDYYAATKSVINNAGTGARVKYASGITRRLDSAARMNVAEGIRRLNIGARNIMGNQFGADGVELSAHALCAPDHINIQGLQYSAGETKIVDGYEYISFSEMNDGLIRHIGTCNCKHYTFPIMLGISSQAYTNIDLKKFKENSEKPIDLGGGNVYTKYECSQIMRKYETKMRYLKDRIIMARAAGNKKVISETEKKLREYQKKYRDVSNKSGLATDYKRAYVPGYREKNNLKTY